MITVSDTCLGMAMVFGMIRHNSCDINVYREEGQCSTFKVFFAKSAFQDENLTGLLPKNGIEILPRGKEVSCWWGTKILFLRDVCSDPQQNGIHSSEANNDKETLPASSRYHGTIVLLVTNVVIFEMSGREIAEAMRQKYPQLKVLFVSGYTEKAIIHHGVLENLINFLQKPVTPNALSIAMSRDHE